MLMDGVHGSEGRKKKHPISRSVKTGLPPGVLVPVGHKYSETTFLTLITYDATGVDMRDGADMGHVKAALASGHKVWLQVHGLHGTALIQEIGELLDLHSLVLEDIVNTDQRPKIEEFESFLLLVLKKVSLFGTEVDTEQVSIALYPNLLVSFHEQDSDFFLPIEGRLKAQGSKMAQRGVDYLAYAIIDLIVDNYYVVLDSLTGEVESLETSLMLTPNVEHLAHLQALKRTSIRLRKSIWPMREILGRIEKIDGDLINDSTTPYLRDVYDHTVQIVENIEGFRDLLSGLLDIYLSSISNRLNEVMKVLTIISTVFIPMTFIAGIYGMNFVHMPELSWKYGYYLTLAAMAAVSGVMVVFFKRRKWL